MTTRSLYLKLILLFLFTAPFASPCLSQTKNMLIYGPTNGCHDALAPGYNVTVWDTATWSTKTTADFAAFDVIVFADCPECGVTPATWTAAAANAGVWGPAISGNVVILGTDLDLHIDAGGPTTTLLNQLIDFASADPNPGPGLYVALSCAYNGLLTPTAVNLLSYFGTFMTIGSGCDDNVHIVAVHPALTGITDAMLSNWGCSTHEGFISWPPTFMPLAIANGASGGTYTASDGTTGLPYIMVMGSEVQPIITYTPTPIPGTPTDTPTITPTYTPTNSPTITETDTPTNSPTISPTLTPTNTPTVSPSVTPTNTPTLTPTPTCFPQIWPNPFVPKYAVRGTVKIGCCPIGSTASFYTLSGELVKTLGEWDRQIEWDGRNKFGVPVSSGIYYYVLQKDDKVYSSGKVLVIDTR